MSMTKHIIRGMLLVLITTLFPYVSSTAAKDMSSLYDEAILREWHPRYQRGILRNFERVIRPRLTPQERRKLVDVQFSFPLRGQENDPSEFYATSPPPTVHMPVLSLKFSQDMSISIAWLQLNRFAIETPFEYISMLKYKDQRDLGGRFPPPLEALKIPADARQNAAVERLANKIFDSAMAFILLHELGHLYWDHPGYGPGVRRADARRNEAEADQFAIEIFRRLGMNPTGMALYFIASAHAVANRADYGSDAAYDSALERETHPLTEDRIRKIANSVRNLASDFARGAPDPRAEVNLINVIANQLSQMADFLTDRELQRFTARIGSTTSLAMLRPRRPGELVAPETGPPLSAKELIPFHGSYRGDIGLPDGSVPIKTFFRRQGNQVNGEYYYGAGQGLLRGEIRGETLSFEWKEGSEWGQGRFQTERGGDAFTGIWGFGKSDRNGGSWSGTRQR
jgi:hypothetical protein